MEFKFKSLLDLLDYFESEKVCFEYLEKSIWDGVPVCPHCISNNVTIRAQRSKLASKKGVKEYRCKEVGCGKNFTATVGTIFESTKIPLRKWYGAIWLATTSSKGISSVILSKQIDVTQKTAWFMLSRIREMLTEIAPSVLSGEVEVDETYIGGKETNKHKSKRRPKEVTGMVDKTPMVGLLQRNGRLVLKTLPKGAANGENIKPIIRQYLSPDAIIYTDGFGAYRGLHKEFAGHGVVSHDLGEYVNGNAHTNSIEGFWALMKRGILGVYHFTSDKHLHRYGNEYAHRYNYRHLTNAAKFNVALSQVNTKRIRYVDLIKDK